MEIKKLNNNSDDNEIWDNFLLKSKTPNIFSHSLYDKKNDDYETKKYLIIKGTEIVASFKLYSKDKNIFNGNSLYCPINYRKISDQNKSSLHHEKNKVLKVLINELILSFKKGTFCLDYKTTDLREFEFYNFDNKKKIFLIDTVSYTTILDTSHFDKDYKNLNNSFFFLNCAETTRQQIRYSQNKNYTFCEDEDIKDLRDIFINTFNRNKLEINFDIDENINFLMNLQKKNLLKIYKTYQNHKLKALAIFGVIGDNAIYLHGGRISDEKDDLSLLFCLVNSFYELKKISVKTIDLEGVNSPKRGYFKTSFGGDIYHYYKINFNKSPN
mgnify:CR=1 FL=1